jgi:hypothetical protein
MYSNLNGVRMGEGSKPELVTVTPMTRGTGNHTGPTISSGGSRGGSRGEVTINILVIVHEREIARISKKFALEDFGFQV